MKKITYIFGGGRLVKINDEHNFAKDFYYGFHLLNNNKNYDAKILEIHPFTKSKTMFLSALQKIDILLTTLFVIEFFLRRSLLFLFISNAIPLEK